MRKANDKVSIVFYSLARNSADLKIRLRYDNLKQGEFFNSLVDLYLNKDPTMLSLIEKIKIDLKKMGKLKLKKTQTDYNKGEDMLQDLGLSENEKQKIYDSIESIGDDLYD